MKKFSFIKGSITLSLILTSFAGSAQPDRFDQLSDGEIWDDPAAGLTVNKSDGNCSNNNEVEFRVDFFNFSPNVAIDYAIKIIKVPLDHLYSIQNSNGNFGYINDELYPTNYNQALQTTVYDGGTVSNATSGNQLYTDIVTITVEVGFAYFATVDAKKNTQIYYRYAVSESFNYENGFTPTSFSLLPTTHVSTSSEPSFYGAITVYEFLQTDDLLFDGTASNCETSYQYTVEDFNLMNWEATNPNSYGPYNGLVGEIDITNAHSYSVGEVYHLGASVGPVWFSEDYFFRLKPATVDAVLTASQGSHQVFVPQRGGLTKIYTVEELCNNIATVYIDGSGSEFEKKYTIRVVEVNSSMNEIGTAQSNTVSTEAPAAINLSQMFTFDQTNSSKTYKATLTVFDDPVSEDIYFNFVPCLGQRIINPATSTGQKHDIHPNPTSGSFTIEFSNVEIDSETSIEVYNLLGEIVLSKEVRSQSARLDLTGNASGMYIIKTTNNDQTTVNRIVLDSNK